MNAIKSNVLLLVVDSLRRDHLACYGYPTATTPNIDEFSASAVQFETAISPSGWTLPVFASILTGTYPSKNGAGQYLEHIPTIMEVLRTIGYKSAVVTDNFFVQPLSKQADDLIYVTPNNVPKMALSRDALSLIGMVGSAFQHRSLSNLRSFAANFLKNRLAVGWIERQRNHGPWFMMVHYDVHWPYDPPMSLRNRFVRPELRSQVDGVRGDVYGIIADQDNLEGKLPVLKSLYDAQIAWVDECVGGLLKHLKSLGILDNTIVIVTSDHGDLLGEHHLLHHEFVLYDPLIRVPLIIKFPQPPKESRKYSGLVQTNDILPTLIDYLNVDASQVTGQVQCKSILKLISGADQREFTISERADWSSTTSRRKIENLEKTYPNYSWRRYAHELVALRTTNYKYIRSSEGRDEMYNLEKDPEEANNLISAEPEKEMELKHKLETWKASFERAPVGEDKEFDSTITKRLRALGYI
jgi:arylsulfatase A-like enzyme